LKEQGIDGVNPGQTQPLDEELLDEEPPDDELPDDELSDEELPDEELPDEELPDEELDESPELLELLELEPAELLEPEVELHAGLHPALSPVAPAPE
jgi:hypothetical protein